MPSPKVSRDSCRLRDPDSPPGDRAVPQNPAGVGSKDRRVSSRPFLGTQMGDGSREDALTHPRAPCLCSLPLDGVYAWNPCAGPSLPGFTLPTVQGRLRFPGVQSVRGDTHRADLTVPCSAGARIASRRLLRLGCSPQPRSKPVTGSPSAHCPASPASTAGPQCP